MPPAITESPITTPRMRGTTTAPIPFNNFLPPDSLITEFRNRKFNRTAPIIVQQFLANLFVSREGFLDHRDRRVCRTNIFYLHGLAFQLFVVREKSFQHQQAVWRQVPRFNVTVELRVASGYRDDFVVACAGIYHGHQSDSARLN